MTNAVSLRTICLISFLFLMIPNWPVFARELPTSECVQCHTDVKKLIRLSWEVEKVRGKPQQSAENEGEG
jgi:hypothetical protein